MISMKNNLKLNQLARKKIGCYAGSANVRQSWKYLHFWADESHLDLIDYNVTELAKNELLKLFLLAMEESAVRTGYQQCPS